MKARKYLIIMLVSLMIPKTSDAQAFKSFLTSTLLNKNVYKTKSKLVVRAVYTDPRRLSNGKVFLSDTSYIIMPPPGGFIRYKELKTEGKTYIRILPGCQAVFNAADTTYRVSIGPGNVDDYIFEVSPDKFNPNNHYLASSAIFGKLFTMPLRIRVEEYNKNNRLLQSNISVNYAFGWKYKLGNHPYRSHYISLIPYGFGISVQKYYYVKTVAPDGKAELSEKTDQVAVTYFSAGITYEYEKFNIGIFTGRDRMFGEQKNWVFHRKNWIGLGIGYELFK